MPLSVNINGSWKESKATYVNINGSWKEAKSIYININGTWKEIASNFIWTYGKDMPKAVFNGMASAIDGKIYVSGGRDTSNNNSVTTMEYNPSTNTWTTKANCPKQKCFCTGGTMANKFVMTQGSADYGSRVEYTPSTNKWTSGSTSSYNAVNPYYGITDDTNYMWLAGGNDSDRILTKAGRFSANNTFTSYQSIPTAIYNGMGLYYNNKFYCAGGQLQGDAWTNKLYIFNISTNTWSQGANLPVNIAAYPVWKSADNQMCILYDKLYKYNPANNSWTTKDVKVPFKPQRGKAVKINDDIYIAATGDGVTYKATAKLLKFQRGALV